MDLIVGKWYKANYPSITFGKFLRLEKDMFYCNTWIHNNILEINEEVPTWLYINQMSEDTLNEVQQYLPEDHPDKVYVFEIESLDYLIPFLTKLNII